MLSLLFHHLNHALPGPLPCLYFIYIIIIQYFIYMSGYKCKLACKCKVIEKLTNGHPLSSSNLTIWLQLDLLKELELRYVFQCNEETKLFISNVFYSRECYDTKTIRNFLTAISREDNSLVCKYCLWTFHQKIFPANDF